MGLTSGTKLGPYEIQSPLGAGGMGEVYRARDTRLGRDVAIKMLPEALAKDADRLRRFEQEARTIAALNHPNILGIYDIGTHDGAPFLVSELLEGQTLREKLETGPPPVRRAIEYALGIAQGLAAAHEKGIVHRDLKPENVFITRDGRIKVLDFGLAKLVRPEESHETVATLASPATLPGTVMGTVGYMSPEQVKGGASDARSDIFSFGAVLYEMLTGKRASVQPSACLHFGGASCPPRWRNNSANSGSHLAEMRKGVWPWMSLAFTLAPWSSSNATTSLCPSCAAQCKAV
jgi:eukaryotic-like serine/threonine-protein kinase